MSESRSISKNGQDCWRAVVEEIQNNAATLEQNYTRTMDEKIVGFVMPEYDLTHTPEWSLHIEVLRYSVRFGPASCKLQLYYLPGGSAMRRVLELSKQDQVSLVILHDDQVGVDVHGRFLTAKAFADQTIQQMFEKVNFPDAR